MADPLFLLAPHRSFTSVICAMLGQHPQMYGLPEVNLFTARTVGEWWVENRGGRGLGGHGLLRAVSQIFYEEQTERTIELARRDIRRSLHSRTGEFFHELAERVSPRLLVDKSPATVYRNEYLSRLHRVFPRARLIHLLRHPRSFGESIYAMPFGKLWIAQQDAFDYSTRPPTLDPQITWHAVHASIRAFLSTLPDEQQMTLRGEDLLTDPDTYLSRIAGWLGLRTDKEAIAEMKHPERSPFACVGPRNAPLGNDPSFLEKPALRPGRAHSQSLEGPLSWRPDGAAFSPGVKELAMSFGYR